MLFKFPLEPIYMPPQTNISAFAIEYIFYGSFSSTETGDEAYITFQGKQTGRTEVFIYMVKSFSSLMRTAWAKISVKRAITNMKVHEYFKWNSSNTYPEDTSSLVAIR